WFAGDKTDQSHETDFRPGHADQRTGDFGAGERRSVDRRVCGYGTGASEGQSTVSVFDQTACRGLTIQRMKKNPSREHTRILGEMERGRLVRVLGMGAIHADEASTLHSPFGAPLAQISNDWREDAGNHAIHERRTSSRRFSNESLPRIWRISLGL